MSNIRCIRCGRFVGKDGYFDVTYDEYTGGLEDGGYSLCAICLKKERGRLKNE